MRSLGVDPSSAAELVLGLLDSDSFRLLLRIHPWWPTGCHPKEQSEAIRVLQPWCRG